MNTTVYPGVGEGVKCPLRILALVSGFTVFFLQDSGRHGSFCIHSTLAIAKFDYSLLFLLCNLGTTKAKLLSN